MSTAFWECPSGGDSDYLQQAGKKNFPSGFWIETVVAGNGKRLEVPVATIVDGKLVPAPGVTWIFPPTKHTPHESQVSA
jgi:hypothetical protein